MTCRAPTSGTTCSGSSPTGAVLSWDAAGRLASWQNAPTSPTTTATSLYDGEGNRVAQQVTSGGTTTTTAYLGALEEVATTGSTTTTTTYYAAAGQRIALAVNGAISYLASDGLGSASVAVDASGTVQASVLYAPYGGVRYSSGTMPTAYGFTGQRVDSATGLDDDHARYYDPVAGQFTSADTVLPGGGYEAWGLSRYAYVAGNPETWIDPSGHIECDQECESGGGPGQYGTPGSTASSGEGTSSSGTAGTGATGVAATTGDFTIQLDTNTTATFDGDGQVTLQGPDGTIIEDVTDATQIGEPDAFTENRATPPPEAEPPLTEPTTKPTAQPTPPTEPGTPATLPTNPGAPTNAAGSSSPANANVPPSAYQAAQYAEDNNGAAQSGYRGNSPFSNDGRGGGQVLPGVDINGDPITYTEYDVNAYQQGVNRGPERIVVGSDGRRWYTNDHYATFIGF